jgi:large subunit ribosomal protein L9
MKVILKKDIAKIGKRFDVKEIANGYAAHLLRTGAVETCTPKKLANLEQMKMENKNAHAGEQASIAEAIAVVKERGIAMAAKSNDDGGLFEGITAEKITQVINDTITEIPARVVVLEEPIKEIGEYDITLTSGDVSATAQLTITVQK